ncbi:MAG: hypothetical protein JRI68_24735, partial [Deltaproteobacteria bacterium]|nr:hypothetical protein [Deltaproteobacteria bacterium]
MGRGLAASCRWAPVVLSVGLALGCDAQPEPLSPQLPAAVSLDTLLFRPSSCVLAGAEAARLFPEDTAAMVVFDRPHELMAALTGSGDLGAPFDQLGVAVSTWASGLDLGLSSLDEITAAGLNIDKPFGLAWLDPDQQTTVLFAAVADPDALEERLDGAAQKHAGGKQKLTRKAIGEAKLLRAGRGSAHATLVHRGHAFFIMADEPVGEPDSIVAAAEAIAAVGDQTLAAHPAFAQVTQRVGYGKHAAAWVQPARWVELKAARLEEQEVQPLAKRLAERKERAAKDKAEAKDAEAAEESRHRRDRNERDSKRLAQLEQRVGALRKLSASLGPVGIGLELSGGRWLAKAWMSRSPSPGFEVLAGQLTPGRDVAHDGWHAALGVRLDPALRLEAVSFALGASAARRWEQALQLGGTEALGQVTDQLSGEVWLTSLRTEPHHRILRLAWKDPDKARAALADAPPAAIPAGAFGGSPFEIDDHDPPLWMRLSVDGLHLARDPVALVLGDRARSKSPDLEPPALLSAAAEGAALAWLPAAEMAALPHRSYLHRSRKPVSRSAADPVEVTVLKRIDELTDRKARRKATKKLKRLEEARDTTSDDLREAALDHHAALDEAHRRLREALGTGVVWCRPAEGGLAIHALSLEPTVTRAARAAAQLLAGTAASETAAKLEQLEAKYETIARALRRMKAKLGRHVSAHDWRRADDVIRGTYPRGDRSMAVAELSVLREASEYGILGMLSADSGILDTDVFGTTGSGFGAPIGEAFGAGGLGLSGIGAGGGGRGEGIGLGSRGASRVGGGTGSGTGVATGGGRLGRSGSSRIPRVRGGATTVSGRLPPEVVQRVVRRRMGA